MSQYQMDFIIAHRKLWSLFFVAMVIASGGTGCDRTQPDTAANSSSARPGKLVTSSDTKVEAAALQLLEKCAGAYSRLTHYQDAGRVVLSYKVDGQPNRDTAPLSVAFQAPNRLAFRAYQTVASSTENRFHLRIKPSTSPSTGGEVVDDPLSKQVISRALPKQIDMAWLMSDSLAAQHIGAGLAGTPPQLELLMAQTPFRALIEGATSIALDGQGAEKGQSYRIVKIERGTAKYRLWISATDSLLRRIELPQSTLPAEMLSDARLSDLHLSIELDEVQTQSTIDWSKWQLPLQPLDQLVRYFVAPPTSQWDERLGKTVPAFRLPSVVSDGQSWSSSDQARQDKIQLLVWLADHPSCRATLAQVKSAMAELSETDRKALSVAAIWAEGEPAAGTTFETLASQWQIDVPLVHDQGTIGRDMLGIVEAPAMIILDRKHRMQFFQQRANPNLTMVLPQLLSRLIQGENLADSMLARLNLQRERFCGQLWLARASDANSGAFTQPGEYPFESIALKKLAKLTTQQSITALASDVNQNLWLLCSNGELQQRNASGEIKKQFDTPWKNIGQPQDQTRQGNGVQRLCVDDRGDYVAGSNPNATELWILNTEQKTTATVSLSGQSLRDFRWLNTAAGSRLAAITASGRTLLIDPLRTEQHSGQCPATPLAIVERSQKDSLASGYVILDDGRIEPVIVEGEGGHRPAALAKPVSTSAGSTPVVDPVLERQLKFMPAAGPWSQWSSDQGTITLARGFLAVDEPAVFVLDSQLRQLWHAPLPVSMAPVSQASVSRSSVSQVNLGSMLSVAIEPQTAQPLWVMASDRTLHVFRADGTLIDHAQVREPIRGVALINTGNELRLWIAHDRELLEFQP